MNLQESPSRPSYPTCLNLNQQDNTSRLSHTGMAFNKTPSLIENVVFQPSADLMYINPSYTNEMLQYQNYVQ